MRLLPLCAADTACEQAQAPNAVCKPGLYLAFKCPRMNLEQVEQTISLVADLGTFYAEHMLGNEPRFCQRTAVWHPESPLRSDRAYEFAERNHAAIGETVRRAVNTSGRYRTIARQYLDERRLGAVASDGAADPDVAKKPDAVASDNKKKPGATASDNKKKPDAVASEVKKEPGATASDVKKEPGATASDVKKEPGATASDVKKEPGVVDSEQARKGRKPRLSLEAKADEPSQPDRKRGRPCKAEDEEPSQAKRGRPRKAQNEEPPQAKRGRPRGAKAD